MKCPSCARQPMRVRYGNPRSYLLATAAGLLTAGIAGWVIGSFAAMFFGWLGALITGLIVGAVISRAASKQGHRLFQTIAFLTTAIGLVIGLFVSGAPLAALVSPISVISVVIASFAAAYAVGRM